MVGAYVAATLVTLAQYLRLKDRRLLLLMAIFAMQSQVIGREWWDPWRELFQVGALTAGLLLVLVLSPRELAPAEAARTAPEAGAGSASSSREAPAGEPRT